ncbi:MAG TPA: serine protease, partial [Verrucomicrobiae bacterium]|nr:serine protease [Verrucomicrobiae bacterium]
PYNYPVSGLRIQIDAAVNPGNSGGPAVVNGEMIGLVFSYLNGSQNISYIIPNEEIELFLTDIADGHYDGKPKLFGEWQPLANPTLRSFLKLDKSVQGILVHDTYNTDSGYPLKKNDVITRIGDEPIDDQGNIRVNDNLHVLFPYQVQKIAKNGSVPLTISRNGKEMKLEVPVPVDRPLLIQALGGAYPSYFIYGPVVFSGVTSEFVSGLMRGTYGASMAVLLGFTGSPLMKSMGDLAGKDREQLVAISSPLFPHKLSEGYANPSWQVVDTINGIKVKSLAHLVEILRDTKDEYIVVEFASHNTQTLVFRRSDVISATEEILNDNDLRSQASPDMLEIWNKSSK